MPVVKCSALTNEGLDVLWGHVERHRAEQQASGALEQNRKRQLLRWMWQMVEGELFDTLKRDPRVTTVAPGLEASVHDGRLTATLAAEEILSAFGVTRPGRD